MRFEYRCEQCGMYDTDYTFAKIGATIDHPCSHCGGLQRRVVSSPYFAREVREHFNIATGTVVSNQREFEDGLKRRSDEQSARTGTDANYVPVDVSDASALGVTEEGLDVTWKRERDSAV